MVSRFVVCCAGLALAACATGGPLFPEAIPAAETQPVASDGDAADDAAIWINYDEPSGSLILATDKTAGLYVYDLEGREVQFLPLPQPNNVDLRQALYVGNIVGDIAVTSNRADSTFSILKVTAEGVAEVQRLPVKTPGPYGICIGSDPTPMVAIAYPSGELDVYALDFDEEFRAERIGLGYAPGAEMEGCVFDEAHHALYVGYEDVGIAKFNTRGLASRDKPVFIDRIGSETGLIADIEGLTIYETGPEAGYLLASIQGDDSFAAYDRRTGNYAGRFRIAKAGDIDGAEETDGIAAKSADLGPAFPEGILVVQDGKNKGEVKRQNFKIVDWRTIRPLLKEAK